MLPSKEDYFYEFTKSCSLRLIIPFLYEVALLTCHSDWNESGRKNLAIAYLHTELVLETLARIDAHSDSEKG